jgi:hypothetical protein
MEHASLGYSLALPTNIRLYLERLARDKRSSLVQTYSRKKLYNIGPKLMAKTLVTK